jgi:hypothetical protein
MPLRLMTKTSRYEVQAQLLLNGKLCVVQTSPSDLDPLLAKTPLAAARKWYWRLTDAHRRLCVRIEVRPWDPTWEPWVLRSLVFPSYVGDGYAFYPVHGWAHKKLR